MKNFEPTNQFVPRVMARVRAYEAARSLDTARTERLLFAGPVRFALSAGGALLGIVNLARILFTFVSPALCG